MLENELGLGSIRRHELSWDILYAKSEEQDWTPYMIKWIYWRCRIQNGFPWQGGEGQARLGCDGPSSGEGQTNGLAPRDQGGGEERVRLRTNGPYEAIGSYEWFTSIIWRIKKRWSEDYMKISNPQGLKERSGTWRYSKAQIGSNKFYIWIQV